MLKDQTHHNLKRISKLIPVHKNTLSGIASTYLGHLFLSQNWCKQQMT